MKMHLEQSEQHLITDYGPGTISVDGNVFSQAIVVGKSGVLENWFEGTAAQLELKDLETVLENKPEILVFGSGERHEFPPPQLMAELSRRGVALEVMSTSAACRTYNVLVSEFRDVSAALLQI